MDKTMSPERAAEIRRTAQPHITSGRDVRFDDDMPRWWQVRASDDRFVIVTRQADFSAKGVLFYSIIDWQIGFRGPCNEIGQGWGDGSLSAAECARLLAALNAGEREVSWRNRVPVQFSPDDARPRVRISAPRADVEASTTA